jgi:hypothetical protein
MKHAWAKRDMHSKFGLQNLKQRAKLEDVGIDGRMILKRTIKEQDMKVWTGLIWLRIGNIGGSSEHVNEPTDSTNDGSLTSSATISFSKRFFSMEVVN